MKIIFMMAGVFLTLFTASASADTIFLDDFQDGNTTGWALGGSGTTNGLVNTFSGNVSIRLRSDRNATQTISTVGFTDVSISLSMAGSNLDNSEVCNAEVSTNGGGSWTTFRQLVNGQDNGEFVTTGDAPVSPAGADDNAGFQVRVGINANRNNESCYFDNILVEGTPDGGGPTTAPEISVSGSANFGLIEVGSSNTSVITVSNDGDAALNVGSLAGLSAPFSLITDNCSNFAVAIGNSCTATVQYSPTAAVTSNDILTIPSDDADEATSSVAVSGTGNIIDVPEPEITVSGSGSFGDITVNDSATTLITVSNDGDGNLNIGTLGGLATPFSIVANNCSHTSIAPGNSCSVTVQYSPTAEVTSNDTLTIPSDDANEATSNLSVNGNGIIETPPPTGCADCIDFNVSTTVAYANQDNSSNFQVQNNGTTLYLEDNTWRQSSFSYNVTADTVIEFDFESTAQGEIHGIGLDADNGLSADRIFKVHGSQSWGISTYDNYSGSGVTHYTIPVGQVYTGNNMLVSFVNDNDGGANNTSFFSNVRVYDVGATPEPEVSVAGSGAFGSVEEGSTSNTTLIVSNTGTAALNVGNITGQAAPYSVTADSCSNTAVAAGGNCTVTVQFAPTGAGSFNDTLNIPSDDANEANTAVALSGTGTALPVNEPEISVTGSGSFGSLDVGSSANATITVSNLGNAALNVGNVTGDAAPFSVTTDNCSNSAVAAGNSCSVTVQFAPTAGGTFNDSLNIPSDDANEANTPVALSGAGVLPPTVCAFDCPGGNGNTGRNTLMFADLEGTNNNDARVNYSNYEIPVNAGDPTNTFNGRLTFSGTDEGFALAPTRSLDALYNDWNSPDPNNFNGRFPESVRVPDFDFEFVQHGSHIIPVRRGLLVTIAANGIDDVDGNLFWEYILEPGRVWQEDDDGDFSRASVPFAIQEAGNDCTHNGVLTFAFNDTGDVTNVAFSIAAETCAYYRFDMYGLMPAIYTPSTVANTAAIQTEYEDEVARRMPTRAIAQLSNDYPGVKQEFFEQGFTGTGVNDVSVYGVAVDGIHYTSACETRQGDFPYCEVMSLPSYSTAKSVAAGIGLMALEQAYPGASDESIGDWVPECSNGNQSNWDNVTFENTLDMATGNYNSSGWETDEIADAAGFLGEFTHAGRIGIGCDSYPAQSTPGSLWVYHTSDTYALGTAMQAFYAAQNGNNGQDLYSDFLVPQVWKPLGLSPSMDTSVRTYDTESQVIYGAGLTYHTDDIVKLAEFLQNGQIGSTQVLNANMLSAIHSQNSPGLDATAAPNSDYDHYDNGFWINNMQPFALGCNNAAWAPYMSGWGGIAVVMLPNDVVYYHVTDSHNYATGFAMWALNDLRGTSNNMCIND